MKTKILALVGGMTALAVGPGLQAAERSHYDFAEVLNAEPVYHIERRPVHDQQCWDEVVTYHDYPDSATATIVGGIIGGVIGNQFGKGHGKQAATVAGTLLGGSIGHDNARARGTRVYQATEERCQSVVHYVEEERLTGYRVRYRYANRTYERMMSHDPGARLRVRVSISPVVSY